jgi:hypothetical protein
MTDKQKKALEDAGVDASVIAELSKDDGTAATIAKLTADLAAANGKSGGILEDKKKFQTQVDELKQQLADLSEKDLGEVERLKLEIQREKSKSEKAEADLTEAKSGYAAEKRNAALSKLGAGTKWLDTVPADTRDMIIKNEFGDIEDLGNQVLVDAKLKSVSEKYAGLIAADVASGGGSKAGGANTGGTNAPVIDKMAGMSDADILANASSLLAAANESE